MVKVQPQTIRGHHPASEAKKKNTQCDKYRHFKATVYTSQSCLLVLVCIAPDPPGAHVHCELAAPCPQHDIKENTTSISKSINDKVPHVEGAQWQCSH